MGRTACTQLQCLYSTAISLLLPWALLTLQSLSACTVQLYLYFHYGPYGLYIASVPVQYSYTSTPPMGRTACTETQCLTVQLYLYTSYGKYGLYTASMPVQYSYTPTHPMDRTACSETQCLYSTAIPLHFVWEVRPVNSLSACTVQLYLYSSYGSYGLYIGAQYLSHFRMYALFQPHAQLFNCVLHPGLIVRPQLHIC